MSEREKEPVRGEIATLIRDFDIYRMGIGPARSPMWCRNLLDRVYAALIREPPSSSDPQAGRESVTPQRCPDGGGEPERALADEILAELGRARTKFPGPNVTMLALMEEVGELAKATFEESRDNVRKEAVQVATMAMRVVLDGDSTLDEWRARKGDALLASLGLTEEI